MSELSLPLNVYFAVAYLDGALEQEPAELRKQWNIVRDHMTTTSPSAVIDDAVIQEAELALNTKVGLGTIRQIEWGTLITLIDAARVAQRIHVGADLLEHVAGLIAMQDGGDIYCPSAQHRDAAEAVIRFFSLRQATLPRAEVQS